MRPTTPDVAKDAIAEVRGTLATLAAFGLFAPANVDGLIARVSIVREAEAAGALADAAVIFEGVPEVPDLKREVFARISKLARTEGHHRLDHLDHHGRRPVGRRRRTPSASSTPTGSIPPI